jgi:hypothetical protein
MGEREALNHTKVFERLRPTLLSSDFLKEIKGPWKKTS